MVSARALLVLILAATVASGFGCRTLGITGNGSSSLQPPNPAITGPDQPPAPPPTVQKLKPGVAVRPSIQPLKGRLTDEEKQQIVRKALLDLQRVFVSSDEQLDLSGGVQGSTLARETMEKRLAELGFKVIQNTQHLVFAPSEQEQDRYRVAFDCNLVVLLKSKAKRLDKFGDFWSFQSTASGKVLNLTTHQIIAQKRLIKRGQRALDEPTAAESAETAAGNDLATSLSDEIARTWEATSLVKATVWINEVETAADVLKLRTELLERPGIYYVSTESWDADSERVCFHVLCRFDVREGLVGYIEQLHDGKVDVCNFGDPIKAKRVGLW